MNTKRQLYQIMGKIMMFYQIVDKLVVSHLGLLRKVVILWTM